MSDFVWTLIAEDLTYNTTYFIKKRYVCVGRDKSGFSKDESRRDGWHLSVICRWCARAGVAEQGREISILSTLRTELVLHLT